MLPSVMLGLEPRAGWCAQSQPHLQPQSALTMLCELVMLSTKRESSSPNAVCELLLRQQMHFLLWTLNSPRSSLPAFREGDYDPPGKGVLRVMGQ